MNNTKLGRINRGLTDRYKMCGGKEVIYRNKCYFFKNGIVYEVQLIDMINNNKPIEELPNKKYGVIINGVVYAYRVIK